MRKKEAMIDTKTPAAETPARPHDDHICIPGDPEGSIYRFIIVAAKRARQLQSGNRQKIQHPSKKMTRVAIDETRRGLVPFMDPETAPPVEEQEEEPLNDQ
jgi:DNA-directed RNA polymerase subunit omega